MVKNQIEEVKKLLKMGFEDLELISFELSIPIEEVKKIKTIKRVNIDWVLNDFKELQILRYNNYMKFKPLHFLHRYLWVKMHDI